MWTDDTCFTLATSIGSVNVPEPERGADALTMSRPSTEMRIRLRRQEYFIRTEPTCAKMEVGRSTHSGVSFGWPTVLTSLHFIHTTDLKWVLLLEGQTTLWLGVLASEEV